MQEAKRINPLVAIAAVSVILFSLVGVGVMTGLIPNSSSKTSESALVTTAPMTMETKSESDNKIKADTAPSGEAKSSGETIQRNCGQTSKAARCSSHCSDAGASQTRSDLHQLWRCHQC